jgi:hypothetical protein
MNWYEWGMRIRLRYHRRTVAKYGSKVCFSWRLGLGTDREYVFKFGAKGLFR